MGLRIHNDHARFNDVIRGRIKKNLKNYIKSGEFISKQGNEKITVPISRIDLPHFKYLDKSQGGVGQGKGDSGDALSKNNSGEEKKAGQDASEHALEVE